MKFLKKSAIVLCCLLIGFINGLLGGGGGMLCVPFLIYFLKFENKKAHASAIFIILISSLVSCVFYIVKGYYQISTGLFVGFSVVVGGIFGAILLKKLSSKTIEVVFYLLMLGAGIKLLI